MSLTVIDIVLQYFNSAWLIWPNIVLSNGNNITSKSSSQPFGTGGLESLMF
jgi:hypothetical protein